MNDLAWWEIAMGAFAAGMLCGFYIQRSIGLCRHDRDELRRFR